MNLKNLEICERTQYGDGNLSLSHLEDSGKCHIMTCSYGEVTSASLNKTQVKRVIRWLERWIKYKERTVGGAE